VGRPEAASHDDIEIGGSIGRYVVLAEVGQGGMGRVTRAYDPKLQREVALKEVRGDELGEVGARRLVEEARAMAKLSHSNVVAVYDVEAIERGRIVLVMEFVDGENLRTWLRAKQRSKPEILERFLAAGRGLAAAHAAGLLHRDFKPSNVLVAHSVVKVTDFGLAKPTSESLEGSMDSLGHSSDSREGLTEAGAVMGTPRYMAPEQHRGDVLTAAADQYSFCVALWEALAGAPPFAGKGQDRLLRAKEAGPPPVPSDVPRAVGEALRRGLSPAVEQRWPNLDALLAVLGVDPRRRRRVVARVAAGGLVLAGAGWWAGREPHTEQCAGARAHLQGVWDDAVRADVRGAMTATGAAYAPQQWERTAATLDAYANAWAAMHTATCEATTIRGEQSAETMDLRMACLHRAKVGLAAVTGVLATADDKVVRNAQALVGDLRSVDRCADIAALQRDVEPPLPEEADAVEAVRSRLARSKAERDAGRFELAQGELDTARAHLRVGPIEYGPVQTEVALEEAFLFDRRGRYDDAERALGKTMHLAAQWGQRDLLRAAVIRRLFVVGFRQQRFDEAMQLRDLAEGLAEGDPLAQSRVLSNLGSIYHAAGKYERAQEALAETLAIRTEHLGPNHLQVAKAANNLAGTYYGTGNYDEAARLYARVIAIRTEALGPQHPDVATSTNNLGGVRLGQGHYAEAATLLERALEVRREVLAPEHPDVAQSLHNLAMARTKSGQWKAAMPLLEEALSIREGSMGPDHPVVAHTLGDIASQHEHRGDYVQAMKIAQRARSIVEAALGSDHPVLAVTLEDVARLHALQHQYAEAEQLYARALRIREASQGPAHPDVARMIGNYALLDLERGQVAPAIAKLERGLGILEEGVGLDHPDALQLQLNLGRARLAEGKPAEALTLFRRVLSKREETLGADHLALCEPTVGLAKVALAQGRPADALALATKAQTILDAAESSATQRAEVQSLLTQTRPTP